ncbi:hypothetical protein OG604_50400 [Streptomyces sp. NBC_01231]|nr:hypothetical protein OG604_50400 [Streptomyces sp. NBC_01231]
MPVAAAIDRQWAAFFGFSSSVLTMTRSTSASVIVHPHDVRPTAPAWSGNGRKPQPRYRHKPSSVWMVSRIW